MENTDAYLWAARIIASCPKYKIPMVLEFLRKGGVEFTDDEVRSLTGADSQHRSKSALKTKRAIQDHPNWKPTDNPHIIKLREAYNEGLSLTELGRRVGLHKTTLYQYLYGNTEPNGMMADEIVYEIFEMMPHLDPRNK